MGSRPAGRVGHPPVLQLAVVLTQRFARMPLPAPRVMCLASGCLALDVGCRRCVRRTGLEDPFWQCLGLLSQDLRAPCLSFPNYKVAMAVTTVL